MVDTYLRLAGILAGDIHQHPATSIKYGLFFEALARQFDLVDVCDVSLHGVARAWNAVQVFHPNPGQWRKRYWQNLPAFHARSKLASQCISALKEKIDIVMQVSVLFDGTQGVNTVPRVIYTDYTASLSSKRPETGRSPFTPGQLDEWLRLEKIAYQRAAHIFTRGEFVRESLIRDYGIEPEKVTAVGGGVNFAQLPEAGESPGDETPVVLFIGRDFYRKGGDLLLHAFAEARRDYPEAKLLVMTRDDLQENFPMEGVELLPPAWDREKLKEYFKRANIFVLPSRLETWGDVLLEAMAYSLPCIGVSEGAMPEIIEDEVTGIVVKPESVSELASALKRVFGDLALRHRFSLAARERVEKFYTWDYVVRLMKPIILNLGTHS